MKIFSIGPDGRLGVLAIACLFLTWHIAAHWLRQPLILPTPYATLNQIPALVGTTAFWRHLAASLGRGLTGFGLSLGMGLLIGLWIGKNSAAHAFFRPLIVLMRSTPVMSVIILALIWFQRNTVPVFATFLMAFPIVVQNVMEGVRGMDRDLLEMTVVYRVPARLRFLHLTLPSLLPFLAAGISSGLGITWKVLIAAEVLAYPQWGIGTQLDTARVYLQTDRVFAWTLVVVILGLFFDYLLAWMLKKPFKAWKEETRG